MINPPPKTGDARLDTFLTDIYEKSLELSNKTKPDIGWSLTDFTADVSGVIGDKRDLIDIVTEYDSIDNLMSLISDQRGLLDKALEEAEKIGEHADWFATILEWWDQNYKVLVDAQESLLYKTEAEESASAAKAAETQAKTAKTQAETAKTKAETAQSKAETAQGKAETAKAAVDETYSEYEALLPSYETAATNAKASETAAKASQTAAKTSETNAKSSETKAKTSETNAKTSETNAKASETKAKASETAAGTSETNAKSSETKAAGHAGDAKASEDLSLEASAAAIVAAISVTGGPRSPRILVHEGTGDPALSNFIDAQVGDIIERASDGARWKVEA